jgi:hypothetical protein
MVLVTKKAKIPLQIVTKRSLLKVLLATICTVGSSTSSFFRRFHHFCRTPSKYHMHLSFTNCMYILVTGLGSSYNLNFVALHRTKQSNCVECAWNLSQQFIWQGKQKQTWPPWRNFELPSARNVGFLPAKHVPLLTVSHQLSQLNQFKVGLGLVFRLNRQL